RPGLSVCTLSNEAVAASTVRSPTNRVAMSENQGLGEASLRDRRACCFALVDCRTWSRLCAVSYVDGACPTPSQRSGGTLSMSDIHHPRQNRLLAALPAPDFERLQPHLTLIPMHLGEAVYESGVALRHVYFPVHSIVSLLYVMVDGASTEIAVVGNEG